MYLSKHARSVISLVFLCVASSASHSQQKICPNGEKREKIDLKQLSLEYGGLEMVGTLGRLAWTGLKVDVKSTTLQVASAATQQWNEYLKGLAVAWNACVISKEEYAEAVQRIVPRLQDDSRLLEVYRKNIDAHRAFDQKQLESILQRYTKEMRRFAEISHESALFDEVTSIASEIKLVRQDLEAVRAENRKGFEDLHAQMNQISQLIINRPGPGGMPPGDNSPSSVVTQTTETSSATSLKPLGGTAFPSISVVGTSWSKEIVSQPALMISRVSEAARAAASAASIKVALIADCDEVPAYFNPDEARGTGESEEDDCSDHEHTGAKLLSLIAAIAPNTQLIPIKAFSKGESTDVALLGAIEIASSNGARIILAPFVVYHAKSEIWNEVIRRARSHGILVIAPAGNGSFGDGSEEPSFPASLQGVLSVASVDQFGGLSKFSNYGNRVSLSAPGEQVDVLVGKGRFGKLTGTSVSSAIVAATAALVLGERPDLSPDHLEAILKSTARPLNPSESRNLGGGIVDAFAATTAAPQLWR